MKIIMSVLVLAVIWGVFALVTQSVTPLIGTDLAIANVNGGSYEWTQMHLMDKSRHVLDNTAIPYILSLLALIGIWWKSIKKYYKNIEK